VQYSGSVNAEFALYNDAEDNGHQRFLEADFGVGKEV
jgi:hypothetical protein